MHKAADGGNSKVLNLSRSCKELVHYKGAHVTDNYD